MNRNQLRILTCDHPIGDPYHGPAFGERCDPATLTLAAPYVLGGIASAVVTSAMSDNGSAAPQAPTVAAPTVMPTPDDNAMKKAQQAQLSSLQSRRGRQSTILDNASSGDLLGA